MEKPELENQKTEAGPPAPGLRASGIPSDLGIKEPGPEAGMRMCPPPPRPSPLSMLQKMARERQEELTSYLETHSLRDAVQWLAQAGVETSESSLRRFLRWFQCRRMREENLELARNVIETRIRDEPDITEEELALFGRKVFARLAIETEDAPEWARQQQVRQREIRLELEQSRVRLARERFQFDAARACVENFAEISATMKNSTLSEGEKVERILQAIWGKSGAGAPQLKIAN